MADAVKVLGQSLPSGGTLTDLYTVPSATSTTCSSIVVCNSSTTAATFRISIAVAGVANTTKQYIFYDFPLSGNNTFIATIGITLATTDVIRVYSSTSALAFTAFGVEIT